MAGMKNGLAGLPLVICLLLNCGEEAVVSSPDVSVFSREGKFRSNLRNTGVYNTWGVREFSGVKW